MNILVTGGTGLIGRQVVSKLLNKHTNHITTCSLDNIKVGAHVHMLEDLTNTEAIEGIFSNEYDQVYHLAGIKGSVDVTVNKPASFFVPLLQMNTNVLEACRKFHIKGVVYTSSIGAYASASIFKEGVGDEGQPMDTYPGWAKRMAELQIRLYGIQYNLHNFAIVRPANVYGPGDNFDPDNAMFVGSLMGKILRGDNPVKIWGDGSAIRDIAYSEDIADGIIKAMNIAYKNRWPQNPPYMNLGSGIGYSIKEVVETMAKIVDFKYEFDVTKSSGWPKRVMDVTLSKKDLGYQSHSLEDGLRKTWQWLLANPNESTKRKNYFNE